MTRVLRSPLVLLAAAIVAACGGGGGGDPEPPAPVVTAKACDASLASMAIPNAKIVRAQAVPAGTLTPAFQTASLTVPALCQVVGYAAPTSDSQINFELWVPPATAWNGKLLVFGNGGYSASIGYGEMLDAVKRGYAAMGGDTGHTGGELTFAIGHPEKIADWGTRSVGEIAIAAKPVVIALQAKPIAKTYYSGCSTGGHQGYSAVQHYPDVFDGVIAGAPGNNRTRLNVAFMDRYLNNRAANDDSGTVILPASKLQMITNAVVAACDAKDGATDGVITDPRKCTFNTATLACSGADAPTCLTPPQKTVLDKFYKDIKNPRTGALIYPAYPLGAEVGYNSYWGTTEPTRADYWRYWVFDDPHYNWWTFDHDRDLMYADFKIGPKVDQVDPNIGAFKTHGAKLIAYNGWADPVVNAIDTIAYYEQVKTLQGGSQAAMDGFFRLFLVPGMGHCGGGTGTSTFDMITALDNWVDKGIPPDSIPASRIVSGAVNRTRPLCPYPKVEKYSGNGSIDDAANFSCVVP